MCNNTLNWFKSHLTNRSQCAKCKGTQSDNLGISIGVLQGSILKPSFYMSMITKTVYNIHQFTADDTPQDVSDKCIDVIEY